MRSVQDTAKRPVVHRYVRIWGVPKPPGSVRCEDVVLVINRLEQRCFSIACGNSRLAVPLLDSGDFGKSHVWAAQPQRPKSLPRNLRLSESSPLGIVSTVEFAYVIEYWLDVAIALVPFIQFVKVIPVQVFPPFG